MTSRSVLVLSLDEVASGLCVYINRAMQECILNVGCEIQGGIMPLEKELNEKYLLEMGLEVT